MIWTVDTAIRLTNNKTQTHLRDGDCWKTVLSMVAGRPKVPKWWPPASSSRPPQLKEMAPHSRSRCLWLPIRFPNTRTCCLCDPALKPEWSLNKETGKKTISQCPTMIQTKIWKSEMCNISQWISLRPTITARQKEENLWKSNQRRRTHQRIDLRYQEERAHCTMSPLSNRMLL